MLQRTNLVVVGMGCVAPAFPALGQPTDTEWNDGHFTANWDAAPNWEDGVPDPTINALHTTDLSDIEVNVTTAVSKSFKGKSGPGRFMLIKQAKKLEVGSGGLVWDTASARKKFPIKFESGQVTPQVMTRLEVAGDVGSDVIGDEGGFDLGFATADLVEITINGDVVYSSITVRDDSTITIGTDTGGGDVINTPVTAGDDCTVTLGDPEQAANVEVRGGAMKFGTALGGSNEVTTVTINGFAGTATNKIDEDWNLRGYAEVTIKKDFIMKDLDDLGEGETLPLIQQLDHAKLTVLGNTDGGDWHVFDDSVFTATETGTSISGGEWEVEDRAMLDATAIAGGDWTVTSKGDGTIGAVGVEVTDKFSPATLLVDEGSVKSADLGDAATGENAVWNMTIMAGGTAEVTKDIYFAGTFDDLDDNSVLTYEGTGNVLSAPTTTGISGFTFQGEVRAKTSHQHPNPGLEVKTKNSPRFVTELVRIDGNDTVSARFDSEEMTLRFMAGGLTTRYVEVFGTDYKSGSTDYNPDDVIFTDSPCVRPFKEVIVEAGETVDVIDLYNATPVSGGETGTFVPEILHALTLTLGTNATVTPDLTGSDHVYWVDGCTYDGGTSCGDCTAQGCIDAFAGFTVVQLTATLFGDFDGDGDGDDVDDTDLFEGAAWCTCARVAGHCTRSDYNPLLDGDCDGDVDEDDLLLYETNYGSGTPPNITAFDDISACLPADVCDPCP